MDRIMERLDQAAARIGASLHGDGGAPFSRVVSDSRQLAPGDLFVALSGEHFDGHDFVAHAGPQGAVGALVSHAVDADLPQIVCGNSLRGLQDYASAWRSAFSLPVIAVTGSNGKTTTKQMLRAVMAARGPVLATEGNLNNHIGVPLTLCRLRDSDETAVIEMGANHHGEIEHLADIARPDIGIVTQAGDAHLEGFGSRQGVATAKGELFERLPAHGVAIINADDFYAPLWMQMAAHCACLRFGLTAAADIRAEAIAEGTDGIRFRLVTPDGARLVTLPMSGRHNVSNALAAAAAGVALGLDIDDIATGLQATEGAAGRVMRRRIANGATVIDDSYNANPTSLRAGLEMLASAPGTRWAVLGAMAELGTDAAKLHAECGRAAQQLGIDRLYALGGMARHYAEGFGPGGHFFESVDDLLAALDAALSADTTMLVKGSRSARMERVVAHFCGDDAAKAH